LGVLAACSFRSPTGSSGGDAAGEVDAPAVDAPGPDATIDPASCRFSGVQCPGGQPLRILPCGPVGECWVGCVNGATQTLDQATQFCRNLGMNIGAFDSDADETCVRGAGINGAILLGITQLADQSNDDVGWIRVADNMPVQYFNWDSGQPNDGPTSGENNEEQCAYSSTSLRWHDTVCSFATARWICRYP